jgi:hypothetical protein
MKANIGVVLTDDGKGFRALAIVDDVFHRFDNTTSDPGVTGPVTGVISDTNCFHRSFRLPPIEASKIPGIMRFEAHLQIPFDMEDVGWDYIVGNDENEPDWCAVLFAARLNLIERLLDDYRLAGIETDCIIPTNIALWNLVKHTGIEDSVMLIYPQSAPQFAGRYNHSVTVAVYTDSYVWCRNIPINPFVLVDTSLDSEVRNSDAADLLAEIKRYIGFYQSINRDEKITCGFTVGLPETVTQFLDSNLISEGVPIEPWQLNEQPIEDIDDAVLAGLALHDHKTNLLPKKKKFHFPKFPSLPEAKSPFWRPAAIIWFLVAMFLTLVKLFT